MNHVAAIVIALVIIGLLIAFLAGMAAIIGAGDDLYREYDDWMRVRKPGTGSDDCVLCRI